MALERIKLVEMIDKEISRGSDENLIRKKMFLMVENAETK
jgi:hypothetical protein